MSEGTIYQEGVPMDQVSASSVPPPQSIGSSQNNLEEKKKSGFNFKRLVKITILLFVILTIIFGVLTFVLPRLNSEEKQVTLSYWGVKEDAVMLEPVINQFEKENPNIKVEYSRQDITDYREKLSTRIKSGNGPDIFKYHNSWFPMIKEDLLPLPQDTMDRKQFGENFYSVSQKDLIKNGAIYGIPTEMDTLALYVNTSLFEESSATPPATWQEFIEVSEKLTKRDEAGRITVSGAAIGTYENVNHAPDILSLLFLQNGVDFENFSEFSEKISDALRFYTTFALTENAVWDSSLDPSIVAFSQGKLAMYFGYYWDYFDIKLQNPGVNFKIYPVPQLLSSNRKNIASYWADGVSSQSTNQKEALLFIKYLAKEETQRMIYEEQVKARGLGQPPGNINLAEELRNTESFVFSDQSVTADSSPFADGTFDNGLNEKLNVLLKEVVGEIVNNSSPESAVDSLTEGYLEVISSFSPQPTK